MGYKDLYIEWIATQHKVPVFMQPWWMDAVCAGKEWNVHMIKGENDTILAAMVYLYRVKWWMKWIIMPQETQIGGIWLDENHEFSSEELTSVCRQVADELAAKKLHYYYQQFPVGSPCPEIFKSLGFNVKERVTYRLDNLGDLDKVIDRFSKNKKRQLQKALSLHAENKLTAEEFYALHMLWLSMQKKKISYSREFFLVLEQKLRRHKQSQILTICNADHEPYAAALLVWDSQRMYYLIPCFNPEYKESGAGEKKYFLI